jgi:ABC-type branched-subunit amino acid transport system substrate-binding protein
MIRIGALAPLSRPGWVEAGRHLLAGLELAVADVNKSSGLDLELVVRDTAADPLKAEAAVDELAALGVVALAGEYHSVVARAAATRADALGVPFLCSSAVLDTLIDHDTNWVARLPPPQSHGWQLYANYLLAEGHTRIAVVTQPSIYWSAGTQILRDHLTTVIELDPHAVPNDLVTSGATALLLLVGTPDPAVQIVKAVRQDPRLRDLLIGAPAGQPEFPEFLKLLGENAAGIPFLRYRPEHLTPLGTQVELALTTHLAEPPSFVALEAYDTIKVLAEAIQTHAPTRADIAASWPHLTVEGTRTTISFTRTPNLPTWQWPTPPIQVTTRTSAGFQVLSAFEGSA